MTEDGDRKPPGGTLDGAAGDVAPAAPGAAAPSVPQPEDPGEAEAVPPPQAVETPAAGDGTSSPPVPPVDPDPEPPVDPPAQVTALPGEPPSGVSVAEQTMLPKPVAQDAAPQHAVPQEPTAPASAHPEPEPPEPAPLSPVLASPAPESTASPLPQVPADGPPAAVELPANLAADPPTEPTPSDSPPPPAEAVPAAIALEPVETLPPAPSSASPATAVPALILPRRTAGFVQYAGWRLVESLATLGVAILLIRLLLPTSTSPDWSGLGERLAVTAPLLLLALLLGAGLGWALGALAIRLGGRLGGIVSGTAELGTSLSPLVLGLLLLLILSGALAWFPPGGFVPWQQDVGSAFLSLVLPAAALGLPLALALTAELWRQARAGRDGRLLAAAADRGIARGRAIAEIIMPQAWAGVWTALILPLSLLPALALVIETAFYLPGLSRQLFGAIAAGDIGGLQLALVALAALVVLVRFVAELLRGATNPLLTDRR